MMNSTLPRKLRIHHIRCYPQAVSPRTALPPPAGVRAFPNPLGYTARGGRFRQHLFNFQMPTVTFLRLLSTIH